ncbi:monooxygenase [Pseudomassariella vexata]|uniref:Monooxygenase n=1 Tax=Pseudomassariella vexata TaxID=1141098 RepID=A0A1Y2DPJ5_9PEZI|nr:monooxygenase [Pseudomassariella vexata]ORY61036.1 monooxygenase [Pseudomassariella vexata]
MSKPLRVIVIGAGLSGLAIAQGLKKNDIDCVVVDKESTPRDRNWGVTIAWSHPFLQKLLPENLWNRLHECQPDPALDSREAGCESVIIRDGQSGQTMVEPPFPGVRRLNIQKTRRSWGECVHVKFGKTITGITLEADSVTAHFQDGTSETGSVLIGSDGGGSWVRRFLLEDAADAQVLPYMFLNFPIRYPAEQARKMERMMHPIVDVGIHPKSMYIGIFLLDKPDLSRPETWIFYILATWPKGENDVVEDRNYVDELRQRMNGWADPYKSAVEWVTTDIQAKPVPLKIWGTKQWDNRGGRVTLSGDAAHSMTFHRGQGANNAICDSERFVSAMVSVKNADRSIKDALDAYDADVLRRGAQEVEVSRVQTDALHDYANFFNSPIMQHGIKPTIDINANDADKV